MADIHIRGVSDSLLWALKRKAADEKLTLKALVVPALEMLANSRPGIFDPDHPAMTDEAASVRDRLEMPGQRPPLTPRRLSKK